MKPGLHNHTKHGLRFSPIVYIFMAYKYPYNRADLTKRAFRFQTLLDPFILLQQFGVTGEETLLFLRHV